MSSLKIKSIKSLKNLKNKTVLVRCDFDVPLSHKNTESTKAQKHKSTIKILDDSRLQACLPTIEYLLKKKAKIILIGHLGRPGRKVAPELSLLPIKEKLEKILSKDLRFKNYDLRINFTNHQSPITNHQILMLENLRFNPDEEKNDKNFAKKLAGLADIYVNEAFAVSHRSAASVDAIKNYLPSYAGLNLVNEIKNLSYVLKNPKKTLIIIIGGAKIETKLPVIKNFLNKADHILIGGAVANDFLLAEGYKVKESLVDKDYIEEAKKILIKSKVKSQKSKLQLKTQNYKDSKIILPIDFVWGNNKILDIGKKTIREYCAIIKKANTIVWNGPMGYFETKKFANGTYEIAKAIFKSKARVIIGGGDTNQILNHNTAYIIHNKKVFVSTGGGAMLEFLGGKKLPGINKLLN